MFTSSSVDDVRSYLRYNGCPQGSVLGSLLLLLYPVICSAVPSAKDKLFANDTNFCMKKILQIFMLKQMQD